MHSAELFDVETQHVDVEIKICCCTGQIWNTLATLQYSNTCMNVCKFVQYIVCLMPSPVPGISLPGPMLGAALGAACASLGQAW